MQCMHALGSTVRQQCTVVEEACVQLLDSPHKQVRQVQRTLSSSHDDQFIALMQSVCARRCRQSAAECLSVRPWCGDHSEWPALVGGLMATIHSLLDSCYPHDDSALRKSLPAPFSLRASGRGIPLRFSLYSLLRFPRPLTFSLVGACIFDQQLTVAWLLIGGFRRSSRLSGIVWVDRLPTSRLVLCQFLYSMC